LTIDGKIVTIKKGLDLSDISPKWIDVNDVNKTNLVLTYDDIIESSNNLEICFTTENKKDSECIKYNVNIISKDNQKVTVSLNNMEKGRYYVKTTIQDRGIDFIQEDKSFKVSDRIAFDFNHHYFVNNGDPNNKLEITVNEKEEDFDCGLVDNIEGKDLYNNSCTLFE